MALMHSDNIQVSQRVRPLSESKVRELMESIRELGLLNPITVTDEGLLVAGYHRLEACRRLAAEDEAYAIVPVSFFEQDEKARQAEIAENLFRNELSVLERAEHLALYLEGLGRSLPAEEQARALGMSRKTFFNYRRIVRDIHPELRQRIKALDPELHSLRNATRQLLELAALPAAQQSAWLDRLEQPAVSDAAQPAKQHKPAPRKTFSLSLPSELKGQISQRAEAHGLKQPEFTRRLLEQALKALEAGELSIEED